MIYNIVAGKRGFHIGKPIKEGEEDSKKDRIEIAYIGISNNPDLITSDSIRDYLMEKVKSRFFDKTPIIRYSPGADEKVVEIGMDNYNGLFKES